MKILLIGKNGQVGFELQRTLAPLGEVIALGRQELDLFNQDGIRTTVRTTRPDIIVNAAAYTAVDKAESEPDQAYAVNGIAPGILAEEAALLRAPLIHYSTDYVFDGTKTTPYKEDDSPNPINIYGSSKLAGEEAIIKIEAKYIIFRTCWVYSLRGQNFLRTILRLAKEKDELSIVADQIGSPTWARMIAEATAQTIGQGQRGEELQGIYHLAASGQTSWHGFAQEILSLKLPAGSRFPILKAVSSSEYQTTATRPSYSVLDCSSLEKAIGLKLPSWESTLRLLLEA